MQAEMKGERVSQGLGVCLLSMVLPQPGSQWPPETCPSFSCPEVPRALSSFFHINPTHPHPQTEQAFHVLAFQPFSFLSSFTHSSNQYLLSIY